VPGFKPINRRTLLCGAGGVAIGLPLMEAMASASRFISAPKRMVATGIFYGLIPEHFHPTKVGADYEMPRLLQPLKQHKDGFTVFSGLDHNIGGGHNSTQYFLSGIPVEYSRGLAEGNISIDQKAANFVGSQTRYPSLSLACKSTPVHHVSWTQNSQAIAPIERPSQLFDLLFKNSNAVQQKKQQRIIVDRKSILDLVRGRAESFKTRLSKNDKEKLDQYFTSIRELERRVQQSSEWLDKPKPKTDYELKQGVDSLTLKDQAPIFYDLMALALQTDSTRVISLTFSELGQDSGGLDGVKSGYHSLSHHGKVKSVIEELTIIEMFHAKQFSRFLDKLKTIREPDGNTLFDSTMSLFGSGMSSGNSHSNRNLPVLLAGGGFNHGQHMHFARDNKKSVSLCNLYLSMLQNFGVEVDQFNNSTGTLTGLEAS